MRGSSEKKPSNSEEMIVNLLERCEMLTEALQGELGLFWIACMAKYTTYCFQVESPLSTLRRSRASTISEESC